MSSPSISQLDSDPEKPLPVGWCWAVVDDVIELCQYGSSAKTHEAATGVPVIRMGNIQDGYLDLANLKYLPVEHEEFPKLLLQPGDLLFNRTNSAELVGKSAIYNGAPTPCSYASYLVALRMQKSCSSKYLCFYLNSLFGRKWVRTVVSQQVGQANVNSTKLRAMRFPLAPLNEQRRIVGKIEELFSDLDAGVAALERAKANLKRYRAAVLKAAVEGDLTAEWRAQHPDTEPASQLLTRILKQRREKWEADQLTKFQSAGKEPPKNWREKYVEPSPPDTNGLPELPSGWCWASVDQSAECLDHFRVPVNKEQREKRSGSVPYYGANGQVGWIDSFLFDEPLVLVVEDETFVGREKPFSYKITGKTWVNNHAHILRATESIDVDFLNIALMRYPFIPLTTGTTARRKLTKNKLMLAPFGLPPIAEQIAIVNEVAATLSQIDAADAAIARDLQRAGRLRQSILQRAFTGQLVPQDPTDEPARTLLERLRVNLTAQSGYHEPATTTPTRKPRKQAAPRSKRRDED